MPCLLRMDIISQSLKDRFMLVFGKLTDGRLTSTQYKFDICCFLWTVNCLRVVNGRVTVRIHHMLSLRQSISQMILCSGKFI